MKTSYIYLLVFNYILLFIAGLIHLDNLIIRDKESNIKYKMVNECQMFVSEQ